LNTEEGGEMDRFKELIPWFVTLIFGAGIMAQSIVGSAAAVADLSADLEEHEDLKGHPVTEERLSTILREQQAIRTEQWNQAQSLAAICAATGASCSIRSIVE
tara:strand:+ start:589 stop:897 length:309 start_codon:yes stop_codon:yes gene_type:complete